MFGAVPYQLWLLVGVIVCVGQAEAVNFGGSTAGIVLGPIFGSIGCIVCIVGCVLLRVCLRAADIQGTETRTQQTLVTGSRVIFERVADTDAPPTCVPSADMQSSNPPPYTTNSANCPLHISVEDTPTPQPLPPEAPPSNPGTGRRVILLRRVCRVPVTNPDAPPTYVPSADMQSSDPPPYTTNSANCPLHISVEDTPTPQPLPPEAPPSNPIEDPPEYLPPPGRDQDREPLLAEEQ